MERFRALVCLSFQDPLTFLPTVGGRPVVLGRPSHDAGKWLVYAPVRRRELW